MTTKNSRPAAHSEPAQATAQFEESEFGPTITINDPFADLLFHDHSGLFNERQAIRAADLAHQWHAWKAKQNPAQATVQPDTDLDGGPIYYCGDCNQRMTLVRPGKHQCDNERCVRNGGQPETQPASQFKAGTGMMGATDTGQRVTSSNVHHLPPGSVVRLDESDGVLIHLHDRLWYYRNGCDWCYDTLENHLWRLPGTLCHIPIASTAPQQAGADKSMTIRLGYEVGDDGDMRIVKLKQEPAGAELPPYATEAYRLRKVAIEAAAFLARASGWNFLDDTSGPRLAQEAKRVRDAVGAIPKAAGADLPTETGVWIYNWTQFFRVFREPNYDGLYAQRINDDGTLPLDDSPRHVEELRRGNWFKAVPTDNTGPSLHELTFELHQAQQRIKELEADETRAEEKQRIRKIKQATCEGCLAAAMGLPLHAVADSGYAARSYAGDAWEHGWGYFNGSATWDEHREQLTADQQKIDQWQIIVKDEMEKSAGLQQKLAAAEQACAAYRGLLTNAAGWADFRADFSAPGTAINGNLNKLLDWLKANGSEDVGRKWFERLQAAETQNLNDMADAVERLREIGRAIGCDHVDDPDGRRQLVSCVEQVIAKAEQERDELREAISPGRTCEQSYYVKVAAKMRERETRIKPMEVNDAEQ